MKPDSFDPTCEGERSSLPLDITEEDLDSFVAGIRSFRIRVKQLESLFLFLAGQQ